MPDPRHGVLETLLVVDGRPVELEAHLARLGASLETLFPDRAALDLSREIEDRAEEITLGSLRVTVEPVDSAEHRAKVERRSPSGAFFPLSGNKAPIPLRTLALPGGLGGHKWADRSVLDEAQAGLPDGALPLIVDADGTVLEASRANLFVVRDGALFTPPLDGRILPGVTRMRVLEIARSLGIDAREAGLCRDDVLGAEEVFLTGSVSGIEPVGSLDGTALAAGGSVATDLADGLRRAWRGTPVA